ncbi:hypothetical protein [Agromyces italicus]|uniref:hypothetical protein n=1 Tax=Agromyces italicus TaxID=279572 RepID=UPI0003B703D8|nr:hypothetical protein [Agromyces italicus]
MTKTVGTTQTALNYSYDNAGNTLTRSTDTLAYDPLGRMTSFTAGTRTQKNVFDAEGNLLLRVDSSEGSTLFLGDTELRKAAGSSSTTGVRTYEFGGMPVAERVSVAGSSTNKVLWLSPDHVGTVGLQVNSASGAITRRWADPYGVTRGRRRRGRRTMAI